MEEGIVATLAIEAEPELLVELQRRAGVPADGAEARRSGGRQSVTNCGRFDLASWDRQVVRLARTGSDTSGPHAPSLRVVFR